jgi:hypothetical protein
MVPLSPWSTRLTVVVACGVVALVMASCSSKAASSTTTTQAPSPSTTVPATTSTRPATTTTSAAPASTDATPAATASCTSAAIDAAVRVVSAQATVNSFGCGGSYAYAFIDMPPPSGSAAGTPGIESTALFQAVGAQWQKADRSTACAGNAVPPSIYQNACETN